MVTMREFRYPEDYDQIVELWKNAGDGIKLRRSDEPAELLKKLQRDPDMFLVAEDREHLVGSVIGGFDGRRGMIYHLAVSAEVREHGIGSMLMEAVECRLREKGCLKVYLLVTRENESAMRFYENRGWNPMDTVRIYGKDL